MSAAFTVWASCGVRSISTASKVISDRPLARMASPGDGSPATSYPWPATNIGCAEVTLLASLEDISPLGSVKV